MLYSARHQVHQRIEESRMTSLPSASDLQLLDIQINALFLFDAAGRMRSTNEYDLPAAPRFFLGRTRAGYRWRVRYDLPAAVVHQLDALCGTEPDGWRLPGQPAHAEAIRALLAAHAAITHEERGPAYWIPQIGQAPAEAVLLSTANAELARDTFPRLIPWLANPANGPVSAVVAHGQVVSYCHCARITPQAAEAGVETLAGFRGKGYASSAVAAWAAAVQRSGRIALYSTWWENSASQAVAKKLGMVQYAEDWSIG